MNELETTQANLEVALATCDQLKGEIQDYVTVLREAVKSDYHGDGPDGQLCSFLLPQRGEDVTFECNCWLRDAKNLLKHIRPEKPQVEQGLAQGLYEALKAVMTTRDGMLRSQLPWDIRKQVDAAIAAYEQVAQVPAPSCTCKSPRCDGLNLISSSPDIGDVYLRCPCLVCHQPQAGAVADGEEQPRRRLEKADKELALAQRLHRDGIPFSVTNELDEIQQGPQGRGAQ